MQTIRWVLATGWVMALSSFIFSACGDGRSTAGLGGDDDATDIVNDDDSSNDDDDSGSNQTVCTPAHERCGDHGIERCNATGTAYTQIESCPHGCDSQRVECLELTALCTAQDTRCADDFNSREQCNDDGTAYETLEICPVGCNATSSSCYEPLVANAGSDVALPQGGTLELVGSATGAENYRCD